MKYNHILLAIATFGMVACAGMQAGADSVQTQALSMEQQKISESQQDTRKAIADSATSTKDGKTDKATAPIVVQNITQRPKQQNKPIVTNDGIVINQIADVNIVTLDEEKVRALLDPRNSKIAQASSAKGARAVADGTEGSLTAMPEYTQVLNTMVDRVLLGVLGEDVLGPNFNLKSTSSALNDNSNKWALRKTGVLNADCKGFCDISGRIFLQLI